MAQSASGGRKGALSYATQLLSTSQPIRAPRSIPVLNPRDMLQRGRKEVLVFTLGCAPTWLRKASYYRLRAWRGLYDPPLATAPVIHPPQADRSRWLPTRHA